MEKIQKTSLIFDMETFFLGFALATVASPKER
jgi:hypothetical protein